MKNKPIKLFLLFLILFINSFVFAETKDFDDLDNSLKEFKRNMKLQKSQQATQQAAQPLKADSFSQGQQKPDKAVIKNQQRFKEFMDSQNKNLAQEIGDWGMKIPKEHRLIIELCALALFISLLGFVIYRQKIKEGQKEYEKEELEKERIRKAKEYITKDLDNENS